MTAPMSNLMQHSSCAQAIANIHKYLDAVCQIDTASPGTGFLIGPHFVLTCCHILPDEKAAKNAYARFEGAKQTLIKLAVKNFFLRKRHLTNTENKKVFDAKHLDFALIALKTTAQHVSQVFELSNCFPPQAGQDVYIIQHPVIEVTKKDPETGRVTQACQLNGDKRIAKGRILRFDRYTIHHNIPVAHGSSGAPIVNSEGHLYAFHQGECPEHPNCYIGVRTDAVFRYMQGQNISLNNREHQVKQEWLSNQAALLNKELKDIYLRQDSLLVFNPGKPQGEWRLKLPLEGLYTSLALLESGQKKALEERESSKQETKEVSDGRISSYEALFESKQQIKLEQLFHHGAFERQAQKRVLFLGAAGIGKSTLCQHIAHQWAQGKLWPEYRAVLWVRLRSIKPNDTLLSLLERVYGKDLAFASLIEDKQWCDETLLLLDGYDEMSSHRKAYALFEQVKQKFSHILLTSRPQPVEFDPVCQVEILGFDSPHIDLFIVHFFEQLSSTRPGIGFGKFQALQTQLKRHPLALSLAHIPVNLTLLCTLTAEEEELFKGDALTMTALYSKIITWMYKWYLLRLRQEGKEALSEADIREMDNPRYEHPKVRALAHVLEQIAWDNMKQNKIFCPSGKVGEMLAQANLTRLDLRCLGLFSIDKGSGAFIHLTFQEFFAACYLANLYTVSRDQARQWITAHKFNPRYQIVLWMTAGYLAEREPENLQLLFDDLYQAPRDLAEIYELRLFARCFEECRTPQAIEQYPRFVQQVRQFLVRNPIENLNCELLRHNPTLFQHPQVLAGIKEWTKTKQFNFFNQLLYLNQVLPEQVMPMIKGGLQDPLADVRKSAVWTIRLLAQAEQAIPDAFWLGLGEDLRNPMESIREAAVEAVGQLAQAKHTIPNAFWLGLGEDLRNPTESIREAVVETVGQLAQAGHAIPEAIRLGIGKGLRDPKSSIRALSVLIVGLLAQAKQTVPNAMWLGLGESLRDPVDSVRKTAVRAVGQLAQAKHAVPNAFWLGLGEDLRNPTESIREAAVGVVGVLAQARQAIPEAIRLGIGEGLRDPKSSIRALSVLIVELLAQAKQAIPDAMWLGLGESLRDPVASVREAAVKAVGQLAQAKHAVPNAFWLGLGEDLRNPTESIRKAAVGAVEVLAQAGQAIPEAIRLGIGEGLRDPKSSIRALSVLIVGLLAQAKHAIPDAMWLGLGESLRDPVASVREAAVEAVGQLAQAKQAVPNAVWLGLEEGLRDPAASVRWVAVGTVGELALAGQAFSEAIWLGLGEGLRDPIASIREGAVGIIEELAQARQAVPTAFWLRLGKGLRNPAASVREATFRVVGQLARADQAVPDAFWLGLEEGLRDPVDSVREAAFWAVGQLAQSGQVVPDAVCLRLGEGLRDPAASVREVTFRAVGQLVQAGQAVPDAFWLGLEEGLRDPVAFVRKATVRAIEELIQAGRVIPDSAWLGLGEGLHDPAESVREAMVGAIGQLVQAGQAVPNAFWLGLGESLHDPAASVREAAFWAVRQLAQAKQAVPDVAWLGFGKGLRNPVASVREAAVWAIGQLAQAGRAVPDTVWLGFGEDLRNPIASVREAVVGAIGQLAQAGRAVPDTVWLGFGEGLSDPAASIREAAVRVIRKLVQDKRAVPEVVWSKLFDQLDHFKEDNTSLELTHKVLIYFNFRECNHYNILTRRFFIKVCSFIGYACFMEAEEFCVIDKSGKMIKLNCKN